MSHSLFYWFLNSAIRAAYFPLMSHSGNSNTNPPNAPRLANFLVTKAVLFPLRIIKK